MSKRGFAYSLLTKVSFLNLYKIMKSICDTNWDFLNYSNKQKVSPNHVQRCFLSKDNILKLIL